MSVIKPVFVSGALLLAVTGCQVVYPTQFVPFSPLNVDSKDGSHGFKVINLTPKAALEANQLWQYTPRATPESLRSDASSGSVQGIVRATTFGATDESYLISQVSENVSSFNSVDDLRDPPPSPAQAYRVGVGDVFTITIEATAEAAGDSRAFQRTTTVDFAGNIFLTDVGEVNVLNQTVGEARQTIADRFRNARLSVNASGTVTEFNSQKVLLSAPGQSVKFLPVTNTPVTLRDAYLLNSSGIDTDARRQIIVFRRDGRNYAIEGLRLLRNSYGYDVFLRDGDEIQIFDELVNSYASAVVSDEVLALSNAEFAREEAARAQKRFEAEERRADRQEKRADEAARLARENANRAEKQLEIARLNVELAQNSETRARLDEARRDRQEARLEAAEVRAKAAEARLEAAEVRERSAEARANRQLQLTEENNERSKRASELAEQTAALTELDSGRTLARTRIDLGIEQKDRIFIAGEVGQQQTIDLPFDRHLSLAEAIYGGAGIEPTTGDPSRIYVVRVKSSVAGRVESFIFHFNASNLVNTPAMTMLQMRPDDYVVVLPRAITNWSRFVTQLVPTLNSVVSGVAIATRP